ncbi:MAG: ATP-binding protein Mrp/Nbp35 family [Bacteroidota bacterium]|jgi:ATP-binding protein involved in chromosome partitioning
MIDNNKVVEALRNVKDPSTGLDIIKAKLVEDLTIRDNQINFSIVLSSNDQNLKTQLNFACIEAINTIFPNADVNIHLKMKSEYVSDQVSALPQVKNIIAVASGKGGVGKSTVSVNLALALQQLGAKVGILDADVYGPSIPTMMGVKGERPRVEVVYGKHKLIPVEAFEIPLMSIGFIVEEEQAVVLRGPRLGGIIRQFIQDCFWPELDYLIIDLPPGTGDVQLTLVQTIPITGAVIVTTPQNIAVIDAVKAMNMFLLDHVNVPILGVVENMSWFTPEELPDNKYLLFGEGGGKALAKKANTILLGQIPLVQGVMESGESGIPCVVKDGHPGRSYFLRAAEKLIQQVYIRNESMEPTRIVNVSS